MGYAQLLLRASAFPPHKWNFFAWEHSSRQLSVFLAQETGNEHHNVGTGGFVVMYSSLPL